MEYEQVKLGNYHLIMVHDLGGLRERLADYWAKYFPNLVLWADDPKEISTVNQIGRFRFEIWIKLEKEAK